MHHGAWAAPTGHRGYFQGPSALWSLISLLPPGGGTKQSLAGAKAWWSPPWGSPVPADPGPGEPAATTCQNLFSGASPASSSCPQNHLMKMPTEKRRFFWVTMKLSIKSQKQG